MATDRSAPRNQLCAVRVVDPNSSSDNESLSLLTGCLTGTSRLSDRLLSKV
jgi:hypothetical protein